MIKQNIRTAPYYNVPNADWEYDLMRELRKELLPKIKRRMPWHHLSGFSHRYIVDYVAKHKKQYPFYFRADIAGFYPSIRHKDVVVAMQVAYRNLLGLQFVLDKFKKRFVPPMLSWLDSLPVQHQGLPIGSPVSCLAAPPAAGACLVIPLARLFY